MKTLVDGTQVPARIYYYLLDWNERDQKKYMIEQFGKERLCDLDRVNFKRLFNKASTSDLNQM